MLLEQNLKDELIAQITVISGYNNSHFWIDSWWLLCIAEIFDISKLVCFHFTDMRHNVLTR